VLTAGTAALKYIIAWEHFAPFVEGALASMNYAGSFLLMQLFGFTLATKQPSMTAAALAATLRDTAGHPDLSKLVSMIARITRSQLAAAIGNVGLVIPSAFAFELFWRSKHGKPFLDDQTAHYVLHSLHPLQSGTIFFAALTGVILWSSSIVAGWLENWAVYRRLPDAIAEHRLGRIVGRRTMAWLSRFFLHNVAGFGGNVAIGLMLGMTPVMGKFFGLPLDVRHVTLSTGALTLSVLSLGTEALYTEAFWGAAAGIAVIGTLNFGVSFVLALAVALRARQVDRSDRWRLLQSVIATYMRSPLQFFFPPREATATKVHGPVSVAPPPMR
jgi:site-specific recombinase